jgi:hypothetical protein
LAGASLRVMEAARARHWHHVSALGLCTAVAVAQACAPDTVRWESERRYATGVTDQAAGPAVQPWVPLTIPVAPICPGSLVAARAPGDTAFAAWWMPRRDSSSALVVARSDDGGAEWRTPIVADSTDHSRAGCARPPPFVAVDSLNAYVHVVYFLVAREGPGVFFTHSMEGGAMFHEPVPIVYGERPSAASVASRGDTVAVLYEDPNASVPQVWLALSRSTGHIFEERMSVSSANASATHPAIAMSSRHVVASWLETARNGGQATTVIRTGTIQR